MLIHSPTTEHRAGKDTRTIPLFSELREIPADACERAEDGSVFVVKQERSRKAAKGMTGWRRCNLRTQFERIIKRAGLTPWPRLFHNLRASRETELASDFPIHVVTDGLGDSAKVALRHYLQVTPDDFDKAKWGGAKSGVPNLKNGVQTAVQ